MFENILSNLFSLLLIKIQYMPKNNKKAAGGIYKELYQYVE